LGLALIPSWAGAASRLPVDSSPEIVARGLAPVRIGQGREQIELSRGTAWRGFNASHAGWRAVWNEMTGTPHRAFGPSIALDNFANNPGSVDRSVRAFISANPAMFGDAPALETVSSTRNGSVWYVRYRQNVRGVPVMFADWEFRVGTNGRLFLFGADARLAQDAVNTTPRISVSAARSAAATGLTADRFEGSDPLYLIPYTTTAGLDYRLVYEIRVRTSPHHANWVTLVDAVSGEVLWRHNLTCAATVTGTVTAQIHPSKCTDALVTRSVRYEDVHLAANTATTDTTGLYSVTCTSGGTVTTNFTGPYCYVDRQDGPADAFFSSTTNCPGTKNVAWTNSNSLASERDAFYHATLAHDNVKRIDPAYTANDLQIPLWVKSIGDECNAYWDGTGIWFGDVLAPCADMGSAPDIVYHEYTHSISYYLYFSHGASLGLQNTALAEGLADVNTAYIRDNPLIGDAIEGPGTYFRNLAGPTLRYPEDLAVGPNQAGLILAEAMWDLRQSVGMAVAERIAHFAKYGLPDDPNTGVAFSEYFLDLLVADDNDADISNGTPHYSQIVNAFNAHGIGTNFFVSIAHTPVDDQPASGPYPVRAIIQYSGPIGGLDPNSPTAFFSVRNLPYAAQLMTPTGNADEWGTDLPSTSGAVFRYYIRVSDVNGGIRTLPDGAPRNVYSFIAGPASAVLVQSMETDPGWTVTNVNATSGLWVRANPVGTACQPEDDHTLNGTLCWVTGNALVEDPPGQNDVDDGSTILTTSTFNAVQSGGFNTPLISYYRWYSNNGGESAGQDFWKVDISNNNGSSWVSVENTNVTDQFWRRVLFNIKDYVTPTTTMKMRFTAEDLGSASLVEAAVDDFAMYGFFDPVGVGDPETPAVLSLSPAAPNPFRAATRMRYTLPVAGRVTLSVYDLEGRSIRNLVTGEQTAGPHSSVWDGRDQTGRPVASGPYFLRLSQNGGGISQAVVRIQ
jgi:Zn-dependent metalloprotease